jgi:hypothetical protein
MLTPLEVRFSLTLKRCHDKNILDCVIVLVPEIRTGWFPGGLDGIQVCMTVSLVTTSVKESQFFVFSRLARSQRFCK